MSKGFLCMLGVIGWIGYFLYQQDSSTRGGSGSAAGGGWVEVTPATFSAEVTASSVPVLAYFWAPW